MGSIWYCFHICVLWRCLPMRYILDSISKTPLKSTGNYPGASWRSQKITRRLSLSFWKQWIEKSQHTSRDSFFHGDEQEHPRYFSGHQTQFQILWKASQGTFKSLQDKPRCWWPWKMKVKAATPAMIWSWSAKNTGYFKASLVLHLEPCPSSCVQTPSCLPHNMMIIPLSAGAAWEQKVGGKDDFLLLYY